MEKTVLIKEELDSLASFQDQQQAFIIQLGQIEYQKELLDQQRKNIKESIKSLEIQQIEMAKSLEEKYGRGTVNLESGEFIKV